MQSYFNFEQRLCIDKRFALPKDNGGSRLERLKLLVLQEPSNNPSNRIQLQRTNESVNSPNVQTCVSSFHSSIPRSIPNLTVSFPLSPFSIPFPHLYLVSSTKCHSRSCTFPYDRHRRFDPIFGNTARNWLRRIAAVAGVVAGLALNKLREVTAGAHIYRGGGKERQRG